MRTSNNHSEDRMPKKPPFTESHRDGDRSAHDLNQIIDCNLYRPPEGLAD